ncbi:hypothetical protein MPTK1_2g06940 [Marchantia polymorpha subsp. ruderalis]|nr:hypothetical protein MARPO_0021s0147 [Marchantia polymorpha]PTQ44300.1 hypothetical protein MARPO_0021s0147 [Marchantia polymorpha]BBN01373.1 hypothetical protein Mp_2g06940 [Marchantia polymorpha subsp. ruderalis]BBN01374.1 hypothetical protein Mp_2g06940 [Marchantia polymorpha subsp. ruderalis]|eukprot:PTQ44299.1 hypothetical protein MARPO_0021s0147 [Marchantia polymorpha]
MERMRDLGPKTPPERSKGFTKRFFLQPKIVAVYPLFGMLTLAFGLAGLTAARHLALSPAVIVDKKKRSSDHFPEMRDPEETVLKSKQFTERSPLYLLSKRSSPGISVSGIQQLPPVLPGDETSATGVQGTGVNQGARAGGI